jgi:hypothetical protein
MDYADWMRAANAKWDAEVERFIGQWDSFVAEARIKLNGMFNPADYPTEAQLRAKFGFRWKVRPIPEASDFRVHLRDAEVTAIRAEIEGEQRVIVDAAMRSVWERMRDVVKSMADRLKAYNPENPAAHPFRDSLVSNIAELLEVLPALNLTNDPNINRFTVEMRELVNHNAQALRDSARIREDIGGRAQTILDQMAQFVA